MSTTVTDLELTIPAKFVPLFRIALVDEIERDADWVKDQNAALAEFYAPDDEGAFRSTSGESHHMDLGTPVRSLAADYALLEHVSGSADRDLTVHASRETLCGALEATIRRAAEDMAAECEIHTPIDGGRIMHRSWAASWAVEQRDRLDPRLDAAAA